MSLLLLFRPRLPHDDYLPRGAVRFPPMRRPQTLVFRPAETTPITVDDDEALILLALSR